MSPLVSMASGASARGFGLFGSGAAASSFESIATVTLSSTQNTVTLSSIPSTYQHLQIRILAKCTASNFGNMDAYLRLNSDSGSNYADHFLRGTGSAVQASSDTSATRAYFTNLADSTYSNIYAASIIDILDYASTSKYKTLRTFSGVEQNTTGGEGRIYLYSGLWMSASATTSISFTPLSGDFSSGSTFALYGIKGS